MHDIGTTQRPKEPAATGMRRVAARIPACTEDDDLEAIGFLHMLRGASEGDEAARHLARQRPRQLERIPFASSEEPTAPEGCRRHVRNSHAASLADHPW